MMATIIHAADLVAVAGVFGAMAFFAFVHAFPVFIKRAAETDGWCIREALPVYCVSGLRASTKPQ